MFQGRKRNQGRSSWWASVKDTGGWLNAVKKAADRKTSAKADVRTGSGVNADRQFKDGTH